MIEVAKILMPCYTHAQHIVTQDYKNISLDGGVIYPIILRSSSQATISIGDGWIAIIPTDWYTLRRIVQ